MDQVRFKRWEEAAPAARRLYARCNRLFRNVLPWALSIDHVGSTAVTGCVTKGDLDVAIRVHAQDLDRSDRVLAGILPRNLGNARTADYSSFSDEARRPALGVQLVVAGSSFDVFTDFLRALRDRPDILERYNALKAAHDGLGMTEYRAAKTVFIEEVIGRSPEF